MTEKSEELGYAVVGQNVLRYDGAEKVMGLAKYSSDMYLPGMLCGKILRSPHGYAKVLSIDTTKAEALPGVEAVITVKDVPQKVMWYPDRLLFATDYVYHNGKPVAAVAAVTEEIAEQALDLIEVEYEVLQGMYTKEDALKPGASLIVPGDSNEAIFGEQVVDDIEDIETGFAKAYLTLEDDYITHNAAGAAQGCHAATSYWDANGNLIEWISAQGADGQDRSFGSYFDIPPNKTLFDAKYSIGSFGPSGAGKDESYISPCLAKKAGKPVMIQMSKEEMLRDHHSNPDSTIHLKMGFTEDGLITAIQWKGLWGCGSGGMALIPVRGATGKCLHLHYYPTGQAEYSIVFYNTNRRGNYRGLSCLNIHFAIEQMLDEAAEELGIHAVDIHLRNQMKTGDRIPGRGPPETWPVVAMADMDQCINRAADSVDFRSRWKGYKTPVAVDGPKQRGLGIADFIHSGAQISRGNAAVKVSTAGTVEVYNCIADPGTGAKTIMAQFCAEELGIFYEDVRIVALDTSMPPGGRCYSSQYTICGGRAITLAARQCKEKVVAEAALLLEVTPEELESKNREIYVKADTTKKVTWAEACAKLTNDIVGENTNRAANFPKQPRNYGTDCCEVEVDTETGEITLKTWSVANDCGVAVNPNQLISSMTGGILQGVGYALMEELIYDGASGVLLTTSSMHYKHPTSLDMPQEHFDMIPVEPFDPEGVFGAHGATEGIMDPCLGLIANAVYNACGVRIKEAPLTPEKILRGLGKI